MRACDFTGDLIKTASRDRNIGLYKSLFGNLESNMSYITLSGFQDKENGEIANVINSGFASERQIIGIDRSKEAIDHNKKIFPKASWIQGSWKKIFLRLATERLEEPGFVFLDTIYYAGNPKLVEDLKATVPYCPISTMLVINACERNRPRNLTMTTTEMYKHLDKSVDLSAWELLDDYEYKRRSARMKMLTITLVRVKW